MEQTKFIVDKNDLQKHLQKVFGAISGKNTLPIYDYILCELKGDILTLTGSDTNIQIQTYLNVIQPEGDSSFCLDKTILDTLKTLPKQPVTIEINSISEQATLTHGSGEFKFAIQTSANYVKMKEFGEVAYAFPAERLKLGIESNLKQSADDELRPVMNGIFVDIQNNSVTYVASDGHRMSKLVDKSLKNIDLKPFNLPGKAAHLLLKFIDDVSDEDKNAYVKSNANNVCISVGHTTMTARLIEGKYPNYNSVIPQNNTIILSANKKELISIIDRLLIVSDSSSSLIKLDAGTEGTIFSAEDISFSKSAREETKMIASKPITIGFKGTYMRDLLSSATTDELVMSFSDPSRAMLVRPHKDEDNYELTLLLMPLMLNN